MTGPLFGVNVSTSAAPGSDPVADAQRAEALGFDFVSASDHPAGAHPTNETWTMLAWIAARTSRITVASRVLGVPFRPPALVAKMAETLDRLSGGRFVLGLGAGASEDEIRSLGLPPRSPRQRIDGLEDAVRILGGAWTERDFTHAGAQYRTDGLQLEPKPARAIPVWLGTFGPRALSLTGRLADGWIPSLGYAPEEALPTMRAAVLASARAAGRDPEAITCMLNVEVGIGVPAADHADHPDAITGSPGEVADRLARFVTLGFSGFNLMPIAPAATQQQEQIARFAAEVIPALS